MTVSDVIHVGDKVDIRLVQQSGMNDKDKPEVYKSKVLDMQDGKLELAMPTENGKLILLPLGVRFEFTFYSQKESIYKGIGRIVERYKKDGFYMLAVEFRTGLEKFQRREFYRHSCTMNFAFYLLDEEQKKMDSTDEILRSIMNAEVKIPMSQGILVDLSGGGMKMRTSQELKKGDKILSVLPLANRQLYVAGRVIHCINAPESAKVLYEGRIEFDIEDDRIREEIIRYIFEEERKIRRKENG